MLFICPFICGFQCWKWKMKTTWWQETLQTIDRMICFISQQFTHPPGNIYFKESSPTTSQSVLHNCECVIMKIEKRDLMTLGANPETKARKTNQYSKKVTEMDKKGHNTFNIINNTVDRGVLFKIYLLLKFLKPCSEICS